MLKMNVFEKFDKNYKEYVVAKYIFHNSSKRANDILDEISSDKKLKSKDIKAILQKISIKKETYKLKPLYNNALVSLQRSKLKWRNRMSQTEMFDFVMSQFSIHKNIYSHTINSCLLYCTLSLLFNNDSKQINLAFFYTFVNFSDNSYELEKTINDLYNYDEELVIEKTSKYSNFENFISFFNLQKISDFKSVSLTSIITVSNVYVKDLINHLRFRYYNYSKNLTPILEEKYNQIKPELLEIMYMRQGWKGYKKKTLEEIGNDIGVTRERVRQKEALSYKRIALSFKMYKDNLLEYIDFKFYKEQCSYISLDVLNKDFNGLGFLIVISLDYLESKQLTFNKKFEVIHRNNLELKSICNSLIKKMPSIIEKSKTKDILVNLFNLNDISVAKVIIEEDFIEKDNYFMKKGYNLSVEVLKTIDKFFPIGYRFSNDEDYNHFITYFLKQYPFLKEIIFSKRRLQGLLLRYGYKWSDKGTFINQIYLPKLDTVMISKIQNYVRNYEIIYYKAIFEEFKFDFIKLGLTNRYMLKGIVDDFLVNDFTLNRDFISYDSNATISNELIKILEKNNGILNIGMVQKYFKGYTMMNLVNMAQTNDRLFILKPERIVDKETLSLSKDIKEEIIKIIEDLIINNQNGFTSASKVYSRLLFSKKEVFKELNYIENSQDFMTILKQYLPDSYYYGKNLISKIKGVDTDQKAIISYINSMSNFTKSDIDLFISNHHLKGINNFQDFIIKISHKFLQIDLNSFVKIDLVDISREKLNKIKYFIDMTLNYKSKINTKSFKRYSMLPDIGFNWNKYLLIGILRTFFSTEFDIEPTADQYHLSDYIIKKGSVSNE